MGGCKWENRGPVHTGVESWRKVWRSWGLWGCAVAVWDAGRMGCWGRGEDEGGLEHSGCVVWGLEVGV